MSDISDLITRIEDSIYENGVQAITGQIMQDTLTDVVETIDSVKQDAESGKGLSEEDFTTALKQKLEAIEGVYIATPGTTTFAEITAAAGEGQVVLAVEDGVIFYYLQYLDDTVAGFASSNVTGVYSYSVTADGWTAMQNEYEQTSNKTASIDAASTDTQYPTAKSVYDFVGVLAQVVGALNELTTTNKDSIVDAINEVDASKQDVIDADHKLAYSLISNTPTIDSALDSSSENAVQNKVVKAAIDDVASDVSQLGLKVDGLPNDEDIDYDSNDKLQFADRAYDSNDPDGLGYKILRKSATFASQVTDTNTVYEIRYDFDLSNGSVTIPSGCVLRFVGGSVLNGTLTGTDTMIEAGLCQIFDTIVWAGTWKVTEVYPEWFGAKGDGATDDTTALQSAIDNSLIANGAPVRLRSGAKHIVTAPLQAKRMNLVSHTNKYKKYGSTISANANFASVTISGKVYNSILLPEEPSYISGVLLECNQVCNAIQFVSWAGGTIERYGIMNALVGIIFGSAELFTIKDCYIYGCGIGIRASRYFYDTSVSMYRPQSTSTVGSIFMLNIKHNMIQACNMGIYIERATDVNIVDNATAHCQMFGIYIDNGQSVKMRRNYSEGDGVCVSDIIQEGTVTGTLPAVTTSSALINDSLDGYAINGTMYRAAICVVTSVDVSVEDLYVSYKKRGQITDISSFDYTRTNAGTDAVIINYRSRNTRIKGTSSYNWNNSSGTTLTIYEMLANFYLLAGFGTSDNVPFPLKLIPNSSGYNYYATEDSRAIEIRRNYPSSLNTALGFDQKTYSLTFDQSPSGFVKAFSEMAVTAADTVEGVPLYKGTATTAAYKWFDPTLLSDGNYEICVFEKRISKSVAGNIALTVTFWNSNGNNVGSWNNGTSDATFYDGQAFINRLIIGEIPSGATKAVVKIGISSSNTTVLDNFLFSPLFIRKIGDTAIPNLYDYITPAS